MTTAFHPVPVALRGKVAHEYHNLVDGKWVASASGRTFEDRNPASASDVIATFPDSDARDVAAAVLAARKAFPAWMATPAPQRGAIIARAVAAMRERLEDLAQAMTWEEGKVLAEARVEVNRGLNAMDFLAGEGRRLTGQTVPSEVPGMFAFTRRRPLGVVGMITPWNFPFAVPAWKLGPALVAGNTVVIKPAEQAPLSTQLIVEALHDAGLPPGVLNLVHGGPEAGKAIVADTRIRAISFTGSTEVGKLINRAAAEHMVKVQLEMGGKNACIVLADADLEKAARDVVSGAFGSTGQRCTATSRVIVERRIKDAFVSRVVELVRQTVKTGNGFEQGVVMGPLIDDRAIVKTEGYVATARNEGNTVVLGGKRASGAGLDQGFFFEPTIIDGVRPEDTLNKEEVFGPVLAFLAADGLADAIEIANSVDYGLSGAIYTRDVAAAFEYAQQLEAGLLHVNCPTIYSEVQLPFGGIKDSGFGGREMGATAIDFYTEWQATYLSYGK